MINLRRTDIFALMSNLIDKCIIFFHLRLPYFNKLLSKLLNCKPMKPMHLFKFENDIKKRT